MNYSGAVFAFFFGAFGFAQLHTAPAVTGDNRQHAADDVYEAVIRYQVRSWDLAADSYCVKVNGKDANRVLLQHLKPLNVAQASSCRQQVQSSGMRIVNRQTGKLSVLFDLETIRWNTDSTAEVDGGYLCGGLCSAHGTYHLAWDGSRWTVTKYEIRVQS